MLQVCVAFGMNALSLFTQVMRIIENIRPDRQTVMFSATFPRQMEALARRILTKPIEIQVCTDSEVSQCMFVTETGVKVSCNEEL
jgi:ATP-dependent RNA helicase DDX46/PRP5